MAFIKPLGISLSARRQCVFSVAQIVAPRMILALRRCTRLQSRILLLIYAPAFACSATKRKRG